MFHIYEGFHLVDAYHKVRHQRKYHPEDSAKRVVKIAIVALVTLLLWNIPTEWFGIQNLTVIQQRVIAIFAFATLMWILEVVSSWATSIAIMVLMLLFCTDSGIAPMVNEEEVGKGLLCRPRDYAVYRWICSGYRRYEDWSRCPIGQSAAEAFRNEE